MIIIVLLYARISAGNSLAVQWLGLHNFTAEGTGSIPGQESRIPQAARYGQKKKRISANPEPVHTLKNPTEVVDSIFYISFMYFHSFIGI